VIVGMIGGNEVARWNVGNELMVIRRAENGAGEGRRDDGI
jgi:hypothetical protein